MAANAAKPEHIIGRRHGPLGCASRPTSRGRHCLTCDRYTTGVGPPPLYLPCPAPPPAASRRWHADLNTALSSGPFIAYSILAARWGSLVVATRGRSTALLDRTKRIINSIRDIPSSNSSSRALVQSCCTSPSAVPIGRVDQSLAGAPRPV